MLKVCLVILSLITVTECITSCRYEKINVEGTAYNNKDFAIVRSDEGRPYLLDKLEEWDSNVVTRRIKVTGRLKIEYHPSKNTGLNPDSTLSYQERPGTWYIILKPKWSFVE